MKMIYGGTPVNSMKVKHYEIDTNSATVQPSDMQAGVTCFARGEKITGTGKAFAFVFCGGIITNTPYSFPLCGVNTIIISSFSNPIKMDMSINDIRQNETISNLTIGTISIDGIDYPISVTVDDTGFIFYCEKTIEIQGFCGKDEHI